MMQISLQVFIVTLSAISKSVFGDCGSLWNDFEDIFGPSQVWLSLPQSKQFCSIIHWDMSRNRRDFGIVMGCTTYERATEIGNGSLGNDKNVALPFFLDEASDLVCYFINRYNIHNFRDLANSGNLLDAMKYIVDYPSALKIHFETYNILEKTVQISNDEISTIVNSQLNPFPPYLTVSIILEFLPEIYTSAQTENKLHLVYLQILKQLHSYDVNYFTTFYWSSHTSKNHGSISIDDISKKIMTWNYFQNTFSEVIAHQTGFCNFEKLKILEDESEFTVDLEGLGINQDTKLASICIAYMLTVFSQNPWVSFVTFSSKPMLMNYRARSIPQTSSVGSTPGFAPYTDRGLIGTGVIVAIADTGLDETSCFFRDPLRKVAKTLVQYAKVDLSQRKIVQYTYVSSADTTDSVEGHGTHVSGIVAGNSYGINMSETIYSGMSVYSGVAPDARIAFMDLALTPSDSISLPATNTLYNVGYNAGARIHTNSWGSLFSCKTCGYYYGKDVDNYLYTHPEFLILFSAGNLGYDGNLSLTREATIKNVMSVGSGETTLFSKNINYIASYSSQGPSYDNRVKPDVIASGAAVRSARSNSNLGPTCKTTDMTGTSMASPAAAGAAALVVQYFQDIKFWKSNCNPTYPSCISFSPSGVLLKAVLLHSTAPMSLYDGDTTKVTLGPPPDIYQGYGRIALQNALPLRNVYNFDLFVADLVVLPAYATVIFVVTVTDSTIPLRLTLVWYDPPSTGSPSKSLLHDLDLTANSPTGTTYYGNNGKTKDYLNPNEKIIVNNPLTGQWKVSVSCKALVYATTQSFSIVITNRGSTTRLQ